MTTLTLNLPDARSAFVDDQAAAGGYPSGEDYVRALILDHQARQTLRALLLEGAASPITGAADAAYFDHLRDRVRSAA